MGELGFDASANFNVSLKYLGAEIRTQSIILKSVHVDNMLCNGKIFILILLIKDDKEKIKSRHDWR